MKNVYLTKETIKILDVHISYNKTLQGDLNYLDSIKNIVNVIRLWQMRKLTIEGKVIIFESLPISKCLALLTRIPNSVIEKLNHIQMFLWGKHDKKKS